MFQSDNPIKNDSEDLLNRAGFANQLAKKIIEFNNQDSIVIGLFGPWGSGKTSLLQITHNNINKLTNEWESKKKPIIIWFNPWNYSEKDQLIRAFFQQLLSEISKTDNKNSKEWKNKLESFGKALGIFESIPTFGTYFKMGREIIGLFTKERTLYEKKENLSKLFTDLNRRIIIILDDIDRLTNQEIRLLFQMIKANVDFPNTIYLLAFDRCVVERALSNEQGTLGREYLEKIVQVGFNIPIADYSLVQQVLLAKLNHAIEQIDVKELDEDRLYSLYNNGFLKLFSTIRDIKRYINSVGMTLPMIYQEIDLIDYLGIEVLRVFLPEVYQGIEENKSIFLQEGFFNINIENQKKQAREKIDQIFKGSGKQYEEIAKSITQNLFPQLGQVYDNTTYVQDWRIQWRKEKRICSPKFFDKYFLFNTPFGEISQFEINQLIQISSNSNNTIRAFEQFNGEKRMGNLIIGLRDRVDSLTSEQVNGLLSATLYLLNTIPESFGDFFGFGSDRQIAFLIQDLLERFEPDQRYRLLLSQICDKKLFYSTAHIIVLNFPRENQIHLFTLEQIEKLKTNWVENIELIALDMTLLSQKKFSYVIFFWKEWLSDEKILYNFLGQITSNPSYFWKFIHNFVKESRSQIAGKYTIDIKKKIDFNEISRYFTLEELNYCLERQEILKYANKSDEGKEILRLLLECINNNIHPDN